MTELVAINGLREAVESALPQWLPRQRWFSGGADIESARCEELSDIAADPRVVLGLVVVRSGTVPSETLYNVPLAVGRPTELRPSDPGAILHEDGEMIVFDALASATTAQPLWRILAGREVVEVQLGRLEGGGEGLDPAISDINPLVREQSNSSLLVGNDHLLKVMRKVVFQPSLELEMTGALAQAGFGHVAVPEGWLHYLRRGETHAALLALVQRFLHNGTEGWRLALTSLRDLYAELEESGAGIDAAQRVRAVEDQGGSFTPDAARLGDITARMHLALAGAGAGALAGVGGGAPGAGELGDTGGGGPRGGALGDGDELAPVPISRSMLERWSAESLGELEALLGSGSRLLIGLEDHAESLRARINAMLSVPAIGIAIRVHGDYHLGQVLRTDAGWTVIDFEGEPLRPVEERRRRQSPMRDVAGMLRSFDYAAGVALAERGVAPGSAEWSAVAPQGRTWAAANREAFWAAYLERTAGTELLPDAGAALTLRRAFEISKAVYEVRYELAHRPQWVSIPLGFLLEATP